MECCCYYYYYLLRDIVMFKHERSFPLLAQYWKYVIVWAKTSVPKLRHENVL